MNMCTGQLVNVSCRQVMWIDDGATQYFSMLYCAIDQLVEYSVLLRVWVITEA